MTDHSNDNQLNAALASFESAAFNFGARFIPDSVVRVSYNNKARQLSDEILTLVNNGKITASEGAKRAAEMRNFIMDSLRLKTSDIARAYAASQKLIGKSLPELEENYAKKIFSRPFLKLTAEQKNTVWVEIVFSAGRPRDKANQLAKVLGKSGRGFICITIAVSVYNITTADDVLKSIARESGVLGGGLLGSVAGGAAAGLACGPGAPICVGIGAFVGGVMFAVGSELAFDSFWN